MCVCVYLGEGGVYVASVCVCVCVSVYESGCIYECMSVFMFVMAYYTY